MSIHKRGINHPVSRTAAFSDEEAQNWVIREEKIRRASSDEKLPDVRRGLARDLGIAPGTVENIRRKRLKGLKARTRDAIHAFAIRQLETSIRAAQHALEMALQSGESPCSPEVIRIRTALQSSIAALREGQELRKRDEKT